MSALSDKGGSAYARYIPLPTLENTVRGMVFSSLLNLVKAQGGEPALEQCQQMLGGDRFERYFVSHATYPAAHFLRVAHAASVMLVPHLGSAENAARRLGIATLKDFTNSQAGQTLLALSGSSPQRLLSSIPSVYRTAMSFGERTVTPRGEKGALITFKRDFLPLAHSEGVILAVLEASTAKNGQVRSRSLGPLDSAYEVSWE